MKDDSDIIHILPIDNISEVGIDDTQRLYVRPEKQTFEYIYRAAAEVDWDNNEKYLFSPKPGEWSNFDWYRQIIIATKGEYGCQLVLTDKTQWTNIPNELKDQICNE